MRLPDFKKCVVFIGIKRPEETVEQIKYIGTAFIIAIPAKNPRFSFLHIVTAKHVAKKLEGVDGLECFLRANLKSGGSEIFGIKNIPWFYHPDETWQTDVAVYPFALGNEVLRQIDCEPIPLASFLSDEIRVQQGIGEGDEVCFVGLFSRHSGNKKNLPIIRTGTIAMIPDEPVPVQKFGNIEAYLIEARSIKGLSGSPVFVLKPTGLQLGEYTVLRSNMNIHFMGLIHGHWDLEPGESVDIEDSEGGNDSVNIGIAIVIPAKKILETVNQPKLVQWRDVQEAQWVARKSPPP